MKNIKENLSQIKPINEYLTEDRVDEGLRDLLKSVKDKFKQAWGYLKGVVAKVGKYFMPVGSDGELLSANTPMTAGQAYNDNAINKSTTTVVMGKAESKIVKAGKYEDAESLYGSGNSLKYWRRLVTEGKTEEQMNAINEARLEHDDKYAGYAVIEDNAKLKKLIKMTLKKKSAPLLIWGAPGIGKTAILSNVLDEMRAEFPNYNLIVKTLANETPDNFTLPAYKDTEFGQRAIDIPKTWLPVYLPTGDPVKDAQADESCGRGLLFIDELSRAPQQVLNVCLALVNERQFNGWNLGSGWTIICASNRMCDDPESQNNLGTAMTNRFLHYYYQPNFNSWREWAEAQGYISPLLLDWLSMAEGSQASGAKYFYNDPNDDEMNCTKLMCTPRSWTNAMINLCNWTDTADLEGWSILDLDDDDIRFALGGAVPSNAVDSFIGFLQIIRSLGDAETLAESIWQKGGKGLKIDEKDLIAASITIGQIIMCHHANSFPTGTEFANLCDWMVKVNNESIAANVFDSFIHQYFNDDTNVAKMVLTMDTSPIDWKTVTSDPKYNAVIDRLAKAMNLTVAELSTGKYFYFQAFKKAASKYGGTLGGLSIGDNDNVLGF